MPYPTQQRLKEIINYNHETGVFTYRISRCRRHKPGDKAGCVKTKQYGRQYRQIYFDFHTCTEHRLAFIYMTGENPDGQIDHINLIGTDNRWENLRLVSQSDNMRNQKLISRNTSGVCGVVKRGNRWGAQIYIEPKNKHLGSFDDWFDAVCARKSADVTHGFGPNHGRRLEEIAKGFREQIKYQEERLGL